MKAAFYTLGCKVNQNESSALEQLFRKEGYEVVPSSQKADIYIVNSCTVTTSGDAKSRQWLRRARRENPHAITVLTGCYPQAFPDFSTLPDADIITGTLNRAHLLRNIEKYISNGQKIIDIVPHQERETFEELPIENIAGHTRAFVKIEDGCNRKCAYCIIPKARGPVRSRDEENILQELRVLLQSGYKEVVFTGINLPSYGRDTGTNLADILEKVAAIEGLERIRFSSLDPDLITEALIRRFASVEKLCPSFHLSLQSGCDKTLANMRRPYNTRQYQTAAALLRSAIPHASLTTDIIVGFPGETEEDFAESLAFVQRMEFLKVHVFPFSSRPGTAAASFENQLSTETKNLRAHQMQHAADKVRAEWIAAQQGNLHEVLLEKQLQKSVFSGHTKNYIPVKVAAASAHKGDIIAVRLGDYDGERCEATPISK